MLPKRRKSGIAVAAAVGAAAFLPAAPAASASAVAGATWDQVAQCESGGDWTLSTGNGYFGGLQFTKTSWLGSGGGKYAPTADRATKEQQIEIAEKLLALQGPGAWPVCGPRAGLAGGPDGGPGGSPGGSPEGGQGGGPAVGSGTSGAPPATPDPAKTSTQTYKVLPGDTLSGIAHKLHISGGWKALYAENKATVSDPNRIYPGQVLIC